MKLVRTPLGLLVVALVVAACSDSAPALVTDLAVPGGFPSAVPLPDGSITRAYTGTPETGFELNATTTLPNGALISFVTRAVADSVEWQLQPVDAGLPLLPGYEADWVIFTRGGDVVTGSGGTYEGGLGINGSDVNILLSPTQQPADGQEPALLPAIRLLPRPATAVGETSYAHGRINVAYAGAEGLFEEVIDAYRAALWNEASVEGYGTAGARSAIGQLGFWRVEIRDFYGINGGPIIFKFEDRMLAFP